MDTNLQFDTEISSLLDFTSIRHLFVLSAATSTRGLSFSTLGAGSHARIASLQNEMKVRRVYKKTTYRWPRFDNVSPPPSSAVKPGRPPL